MAPSLPGGVGCNTAGKMGSRICMEVVTVQGVKLDICWGELVFARIRSLFRLRELPLGGRGGGSVLWDVVRGLGRKVRGGGSGGGLPCSGRPGDRHRTCSAGRCANRGSTASKLRIWCNRSKLPFCKFCVAFWGLP